MGSAASRGKAAGGQEHTSAAVSCVPGKGVGCVPGDTAPLPPPPPSPVDIFLRAWRDSSAPEPQLHELEGIAGVTVRCPHGEEPQRMAPDGQLLVHALSPAGLLHVLRTRRGGIGRCGPGDDAAALVGVGVPVDALRASVERGDEWRLVLCKEAAEAADWAGLLRAARAVCSADACARLEAHWPAVSAFPYAAGVLSAEECAAARDAEQRREGAAPRLHERTFLEGEDTAAAARLFVWHALGAGEWFRGDGSSPHYVPACLLPNKPLRDLRGMRVHRLHPHPPPPFAPLDGPVPARECLARPDVAFTLRSPAGAWDWCVGGAAAVDAYGACARLTCCSFQGGFRVGRWNGYGTLDELWMACTWFPALEKALRVRPDAAHPWAGDDGALEVAVPAHVVQRFSPWEESSACMCRVGPHALALADTHNERLVCPRIVVDLHAFARALLECARGELLSFATAVHHEVRLRTAAAEADAPLHRLAEIASNVPCPTDLAESLDALECALRESVRDFGA